MKAPLLFVGMTLLLTACGGNNGVATDTNDEGSLQVASGHALYEANCAACHGVQGEGIGTAPPHNDQGHTWHHADSQLYAIVARGGMSPGSAMPAYEDILTHAEIVSVLDYIKEFWSPESRATQARVSETLPYPPAP